MFRSAFIGLCASSLSDICSNSLRVLKTTKQTLGGGGKKSISEVKGVKEGVKEVEKGVTVMESSGSEVIESKSQLITSSSIIDEVGMKTIKTKTEGSTDTNTIPVTQTGTEIKTDTE